MKITQMEALGNSLFSLTDEGELWEFKVDTREWSRCKSIGDSEVILEQRNNILIEELDVSSRVLNVLSRNNINTIGELTALDNNILKTLPGLGEKSRFELENALQLFLEVGI